MRFATLLALLLPSFAIAQPGAANLNPTGGLRQTPANVTGVPLYLGGVPYVSVPAYNPYFGTGYQNVPVYWWLDPAFVWNPYNLYGTPGYVLPPITAGPSLFMPPYYGLPPQPILPPQAGMPAPQPPADNLGRAEKPRKEMPKDARPRDNLDQQAVMRRELKAGDADFAAGRFAAALKRYELGSQAQPLDPLPLFHQAQAQFALGQHAKAVPLVQRGLKWNPNWPQAAFLPRALYGEASTAFDQQLANLAEAIEKRPNDDSLLFLMGYELWFDGKRDQAKTLFQRAASLTVDTAAIDRFLK